MKRGRDPRVAYDRIQMPYVYTYQGARHALLILSDVRPESRVLIAPLNDVIANKARWTAVAGFDDEITDVQIDGDSLYLLANKAAPRGRILRTQVLAPILSSATQIVPQGPRVIESFSRARDGFYLRIMDGGIGRLELLRRETLEEIALPFDGTLGALETSPDEDGALFSLQGWLTPSDVWKVDAHGHPAPTGLTPKPPVDVSSYETVRLFAAARDGTRIPYSLIYKKGLKLDGV